MAGWNEIDGLEGQALAYAMRADHLACADRRHEAVDAFRTALALIPAGTPAARDLAARLAWLGTPHHAQDTPPAGG